MSKVNGLEKESSGVLGSAGRPLIWSKHSTQTLALTIGEEGDSNAVIGTPRGGWMKLRLEVSRRGIKCKLQSAQKIPPHFLQ